MRTSISAHAPERRGFGVGGIGWRPVTASTWMGAPFVIALALAAIVLVLFGAGNRGTSAGFAVTGELFLSSVLARYRSGAMASLCGPRLDRLARRGRELGV